MSSLSVDTVRSAVPTSGSISIVGRAAPSVGPDDVLIRVAYSAVNRADTLQRRGLYAPPPGATDVLGLEAVGVVVSVGEGVPEGAPAVGSRVMALLSGGGNADVTLARAAHCMPVPARLSLREAAAIPEAWLTAFQLLFLVAAGGDAGDGGGGGGDSGGVGGALPLSPVRAGSTVVIHAAGSGVGTAAVQLALAVGARVVAVAGSEEKLTALRALGVAHEDAINHGGAGGAATFAARLKNVVGPAGAAVVLDPVGASFAGANADALGVDGVWVLYGSMGGLRLTEDVAPGVAASLLSTLLRKRATLVGTTLRNRSDAYKARLVAHFSAFALPRFNNGSLRVLIDSEFSLDDLAAAHARMESNANIGKIIIRAAGADGEESGEGVAAVAVGPHGEHKV